MNPAHLHLMVDHLPVLGAPFVALLLAWALHRRSRDLLRAALGGAVFVAAVSYPVFLTGEPAEERVEDASWANQRLLHQHEERAELGLLAALLTGAVAAAALWQSRGGREVPGTTAAITLAGLALCAALFAATALSGGRIRHAEIRPGAVAGLDSAGAEDPADSD
jgi:drug/metabolite transporter (DMT)-like permease